MVVIVMQKYISSDFYILKARRGKIELLSLDRCWCI